MDQERLLRITEVQQRVGIARSTIWLWIKQGRFPKGMKLSPSVTVWHEKEINLYVAGKWNT
ncbi:MAG: AlpA family phage regulatory protein [Sulfuricurvum sp.]|nr:AlpA family phage regulatory protein [Sulfuricurvum sp.]